MTYVPDFPYKPLSDNIIAEVLEALPDPVVTVLEENNIILAGGFIRAIVAKEAPRDIDLFVMEESEEERKRVARAVAKSLWDHSPLKSVYAFTVEPQGMPPIQLVHYWPVASPEALMNRFDFTVCKAAMWFEGSFPMPVGACDIMFYDDAKMKVIRYADPIREPGELNVADSIRRAFRFRDRGYSLPLIDPLS